MKPKRFREQKYRKIRSKCAKKSELFTDDAFPPKSQSLYFSKPAPSDIEWKRPGDLVDNPKLFEVGTSASRITQGKLGNCWFVAACSCIAQEPELVNQIIPNIESQEWKRGQKYTGVFHFRFYHFGEWHDVVIDDFLPTQNNELVFAHCRAPNVFWSALLEKAYAKFYGNYESLIAGLAREALVDLLGPGGVGERVKVGDATADPEQRKAFFTNMSEGFKNHSMMIASIEDSQSSRERELPNGLVTGHAYGITDVRLVKLGSGIRAFFKRERVEMVRLRNPWNRKGWTGPWSDGSEDWAQISKGRKKKMGLNFEDDGEFWMSFEDFCQNFNHMDVCKRINTSRFTFKKTWKKKVFVGSWSNDKRTSGGCSNNKNTFLNNPQYIFEIYEDGEELMIALDQEDSRTEKKSGKENQKIGFAIIKADVNREYRMHDYWQRIPTLPFGTSRSVFEKLSLQKGRYVLIPSTFEPGREGRFHLQVYSERNIHLRALTEDGPKPGLKYKSATQIYIISAEVSENQRKIESDWFCIVKCEGKELKTPICHSGLCPEWNTRATIYRKTPKSDVVIEVRIKTFFADELVGVVRLPGSMDSTQKDCKQLEPILKTTKDKTEMKIGKLHLQIHHFEDMAKA